MNTFNRKSLYAALAGLGALSATGAAQAVNLSPEGLGQVLIYPYYTVRAPASGNAYNTLLSVVNTTNSAKAVKVRFLEGKNSQEVLDFNLFLSKFDVWVATVIATPTGAAVTSTDKSCILPQYLAAAGQPFVNFKYATDGADPSLDRTREGYVEIIEMATFPNGTCTQIQITHSAGVPFDCPGLSDAGAAADATVGSGGLFGAMTLINVFDGSAYSQDATAIDNFNYQVPIYFDAGDERPNLGFVLPTQSAVIANGNAVVTNWPGAPIDAVSAVLMHNSVMNEYATEPGILANTDWVITMPTKNQYVKVGTGTATQPFQRNFNGTAGACDDISLQTWDREERTPSSPGGFSPPQPGVVPKLCWEANVIQFEAAGVLGSTNSRVIALAAGQVNGWAQLSFVYSKALLIGGFTTTVNLVNGVGFSSAATATYAGLPVVGFAVQAYNNNILSIGGKNVQSAYGSDFNHRYKTSIKSP
jgi:hypothetical protein